VAIDSLRSGEKYQQLGEEIEDAVKLRWQRMGQDQKINSLVEIYWYLSKGLNNTSDPAIKEELRKQMGIISDCLISDFGFDQIMVDDEVAYYEKKKLANKNEDHVKLDKEETEKPPRRSQATHNPVH
jgi:hypothetical protein